MSLKGQIFTIADAPLSIQKDPVLAQAWADEQTARYTVVALDLGADPADEQIIAEEVTPRILARLTPKARRAAGLLIRMPLTDRQQLLSAFDSKAALINPFTAVDTGGPVTP